MIFNYIYGYYPPDALYYIMSCGIIFLICLLIFNFLLSINKIYKSGYKKSLYKSLKLIAAVLVLTFPLVFIINLLLSIYVIPIFAIIIVFINYSWLSKILKETKIVGKEKKECLNYTHFFSVFLMILSFCLTFFLYHAYSKHEKSIVNRIVSNKIWKVDNISSKLENQLKDLEKGESTYRRRIDTLVYEIKEEKRKYNISSLSKATDRIRYNMKLIQSADAYITEVRRLKVITVSSFEESVFLKRMLEDKQTMVEMVGVGKSLSKEIDKFLTNHNPYTEKIAIKPENLKLKSMEEIWKEID